MTRTFTKRTASVLALGFALTLIAEPSLAQEHRRGQDRGNSSSSSSDDRSRGSWNNHAPLARPSDSRPARQVEQQPQAQQQPAARPSRDDGDGGQRPQQNRPSNGGGYNGDRNQSGNNAGRPDNNRPDNNRSDNNRPDNGRSDNGRSGYGRPDNGRPSNNGRADDGRQNYGRPGGDYGRSGGNSDRGNWNGGGRAPHFDYHSDRRFRGYSGVRYGFYFFPGTGYYRVPSQWYGHRWYSGEYLPDFFYSYRIYDWDYYGLPQPPYGCAWFFVGEDAVLVDLDTGRVIDVYYDIY